MKWRQKAFRGCASSWVSCFPLLETQPFPSASHRSVVTASLSCCVSQWWLHKFKLAGFVHKGGKLEDREKQLCSCIFHVLSGSWYKQNAFPSGFWQPLPNLSEKWFWLLLCSQMRLLKTYSLSGNFVFFPRTSNKIRFHVMFNCRRFQVLRSLSWQMWKEGEKTQTKPNTPHLPFFLSNLNTYSFWQYPQFLYYLTDLRSCWQQIFATTYMVIFSCYFLCIVSKQVFFWNYINLTWIIHLNSFISAINFFIGL